MALTKDDILQGFVAPKNEDEVTPLFSAEDLKRSVIEDQVQNLRQEAAKGKKPPVVSAKAPNIKNEAITGSKSPRLVGPPPGSIETGLEGVGGAAGGTAGALYGAQLGAPFGPAGAAIGGFGGGVIGAGLGLAGTRAAIEGGKAAIGARPPITADEAIASGRRALLEGMAGEGAFRTLSMFPKGYYALKSKMLAGDIKPAEMNLYKQAQDMGIHLTPSTLTDSKTPKMVESTLRRTMGGSGKFTVNDINNELALRKGVDDWADQTLGKFSRPGDDPAMSSMRYGDIVQKAIKGEVIPEQKQMVKALYTNLDQQTGGAAIVDPTALYGELQAIRNSLAKRGEKTYAGAIETLDHVLERITKKGNVTGLTVERQMQDLPPKMIPGKVTATPQTEDITALVPGKSNVNIKREVTDPGTPDLQSVERGTKPYDKGFVIPGEPATSEVRGIKTNTEWQKIKTGDQFTGLKTNREYQAIPQGQQLTGLKVTEKSDAPRQPRNLTFSEAQDIRSIIGSDIGHEGPALPGSEVEKLKKAYALMTEHMGNAAIDFTKATGKDINLSWMLADAMNRRGHQLFNESIVARAIQNKPEDVVQTVFKKNALSETRELVRSLDTKPEVLNAYRRGVVEQLIQEATDKSTERVVGANFAKAARSRGEAVLKETFGENYGGFKRLLEVAERMPKQNESGMLWFEQGLFVRGAVSALPIAGAVIGHIADSPGLIAASATAPAAWFIGTKTLANILTSKEATNKLLAVRRLDPRSAMFARTMAQLGAIEVGETGRPMEGTNRPRMGLMTGIGQRLME